MTAQPPNLMTSLPISVIVIVKDAAQTLDRLLRSLSYFKEIIIYENGSTDNTIEIAQQYINVKLITGDFLGFGPTKNHAASFASHDWVLSLDADEVLPMSLQQEISQLPLSNINTVYQLKRINLFMGKPVSYGSWGSDWLIRLYHRTPHQFTPDFVHEQVMTHPYSNVVKLTNSFDHLAVTDISQFLVKINRYSDIRKTTAKKSYPVVIIVLKTFWAFFRTYFFRLGFLDGWRGLVIAVSNANGVFYKYMKIYAARHT